VHGGGRGGLTGGIFLSFFLSQRGHQCNARKPLL
jgi:hypothetical protein